MKRFTALSLVVVLTVFFGTLAIAYPIWDENGQTQAVAYNLGTHQVVYGKVLEYGSSFVFTISNGNSTQPLHLDVHFEFINTKGDKIGDIMRHWWCAASLGRSARQCDCRFRDRGMAYYSEADTIKMFASRNYIPGYDSRRSCS
jgi:hypothetical protein